MKKKRNIIIAGLLVFFVFLALIMFLYFKKIDPSEMIEEIDEQEVIIQEQLKELENIREERRGGEEYVPPTDDDIQSQLDELEMLRRRE